jgi:hypothetical protein
MKISSQARDRLYLALIVVMCVGSAAGVALGVGPLGRANEWFDPLFVQYNLGLLLLAQLSLPFITSIYVRKMKGEKERRLAREIPRELWERERDGVQRRLDAHFKFRNYLGSLLLALVMVTLGLAIILFLKPVSMVGPNVAGVSYGLGVNFLLAGPVIELPATSPVLYHRIILSLTAFQFGFLGAYAFFVTGLVRSYFVLDLTPHTYVDGAVRMATASVLTLIVSFALPIDPLCTATAPAGCVHHPLPLIGFFLGYFPNRALLLIEKMATKLVRLGQMAYNATSLANLAGMSLAHEVRLGREGFDSAENLSHADALDLAIRTGFGYRQLRQWIGEAWLRSRFGDDYDAFAGRTALTNRDDLDAFLLDWEATKRAGDVVAHLAGDRAALATKIDGVCALLRHARTGGMVPQPFEHAAEPGRVPSRAAA